MIKLFTTGLMMKDVRRQGAVLRADQRRHGERCSIEMSGTRKRSNVTEQGQSGRRCRRKSRKSGSGLIDGQRARAFIKIIRTIWKKNFLVGKVMLTNRKVGFFMIFVNDDTRTADKLSFAVNAKPHVLSEAEKEAVTAAAEGIVSVFEEDMPGRFAGIFVYEAVSEKDVDCFVFQSDDNWFLLICRHRLKWEGRPLFKGN